MHSEIKQLQEVKQSTAHRHAHYRGRRKFTGSVRDTPRECGKCDRSHAPGKEFCPARRAECYKCHKRVTSRKFAEQKVYAKSLKRASPPCILLEVSFLRRFRTGWREIVAIQEDLVNFKLDSGADVTIIAEATLNQLIKKLKLKPVYNKLTSPGGQLAWWQFVVRSIIDGQKLHYRVIVAKTTDNLLNRSVALKMGFMKRVYILMKSKTSTGT